MKVNSPSSMSVTIDDTFPLDVSHTPASLSDINPSDVPLAPTSHDTLPTSTLSHMDDTSPLDVSIAPGSQSASHGSHHPYADPVQDRFSPSKNIF